MRKRIAWILTFFLACTVASQPPRPQAEEKYQISISVKIIPIFATDANGEPVFDLKKEDLVLIVNNTERQVTHLIRRGFEEEAEVEETSRQVVAQLDRHVYIVLDTGFNSFFGLQRTKSLAGRIIELAPPQDKIILMTLGWNKGLKLIVGPDTPREELAKKLKEIDLIPEYSGTASETSISDAGLAVQNYLIFLNKLKFELKMYRGPKLAYLISEGIHRNLLYDSNGKIQSFYFSLMRETVKSINEGGVALFTVNPGRLRNQLASDSGKTALDFLSEETGGKYFEGSEVENIVTEIRKSTGAYYEAVCEVEESTQTSPLSIEVKSKRPDLRLITPQILSRDKKYNNMSLSERRFYILNVVTEEDWINPLEKVSRTAHTLVKSSEKEDKVNLKIEVELPSGWGRQEADIYTVRIPDDVRDAKIRRRNKQVKNPLALTIKGRKGERFYFAVVARQLDQTVYGKIKL
jgi:VWFA-related protein